MAKDSGEVERTGVSGERKSRVVGGFVWIVLGGVILILILAIAFFALRGRNSVPESTAQPKTQSEARRAPPYLYA